jgi:hypothetical protein
MGAEAVESVPALEEAQKKDRDADVRLAATKALELIRRPT